MLNPEMITEMTRLHMKRIGRKSKILVPFFIMLYYVVLNLMYVTASVVHPVWAGVIMIVVVLPIGILFSLIITAYTYIGDINVILDKEDIKKTNMGARFIGSIIGLYLYQLIFWVVQYQISVLILSISDMFGSIIFWGYIVGIFILCLILVNATFVSISPKFSASKKFVERKLKENPSEFSDKKSYCEIMDKYGYLENIEPKMDTYVSD